jgi:DNA invertase Pin-like site-specific DNA recombinase
MKVALYARVSTDDKEQNPDTQLYALRQYCTDAHHAIYREYVDKARAKDYKHRTAWTEMLTDSRLRKFDLVVVFRLDRAFRSVKECVNTVSEWHDRNIGFKSIREDIIDTSTSQGTFILHIISAVAELESSTISDRVKAGMSRSKSQGNRMGRKPLPLDFVTIRDTLSGCVTVGEAAKQLKCSRPYIYKVCKMNNLDPMMMLVNHVTKATPKITLTKHR